MTIDDFRGNFGNFDENRPLQAVEIGLFANNCLQNEKSFMKQYFSTELFAIF